MKWLHSARQEYPKEINKVYTEKKRFSELLSLAYMKEINKHALKEIYM